MGVPTKKDVYKRQAESLAEKLNALLTAGGDNGFVMLAADTEFILYSLGYGFSQRRISLGNAVLESGGGVVFVYVSGRCV